MKTTFTIGFKCPGIVVSILLATAQLYSQSITVSNETFPNTFNTGFTAPAQNVNSGNFTGSIGTWHASSNANATIVVLAAYYSPVTNAIKIVNWNTTGNTFGECSATSPTVNLSNYNCTSAMNLQFKLYTYTCNSADVNTILHLEYSTNNGSTWTSVYSRSSAQIFNTWGANAITTITVPINQSYRVSTFKYRFRGYKPGNQGNDFYVFIDDVKILADACPCNPDDGHATHGFCAPAPTCSNTNTVNWSQTINVSNGDPSIVRFWHGATTTYTIPSSFYPASLSGSCIVTVTEAVSYDGYSGRNTVSQPNERWRVLFRKSGSTIYATPYTNDVPDFQNQAYWKGPLGVATLLPNGADAIVIEHYSVGTGDGSNPNSVSPVSVCINVTQATGSIGDRVWFDANGNGIQDATETGGITGITVQLKNSAGTVIATTNTNASGNYLFSNLPAGNYTVVFPSAISGAIVTTPNVGSNDDIDSDASQSTGETHVITLAAGQHITNVDAGYCPVTLVLGNFVWNDLNDNGVQDSGEPGISGAVVRLYKDDNGDNVPDGSAIASTTTDANGNYSFGSLGPGNYIVGVVIPSGYSAGATTATSANPNNDNNTDNNGVSVVSGELRSNYITLTGGGEPTNDGDGADGNLTLDIALKARGSISDRVWNDLDRDGIQDAGELGLAGVTVSLYDNSNNLIASTVTDAYGLYKFSNLPVSAAGINYQVRFSLPPGYVFSPQNADAAGVTGANNSDANATTGRTGNITLTVATPNVTYVDAGMYLTLPSRIGDFIWNDLDKDGIQDAGEPGLAGIVVTLYDNAGNPVRTTITDNNGFYQFIDVPNGTYTLGITPPPGYQLSPKDATGDAADSDFNPTTFRTDPFTVTTGVNLTLDGGLNVTDTTKASIGDFVWADLDNDNVQDPNEPGIAGVTVQLYTSANVLVATTTTNALGYYVFNNVNPGSYYVRFSNIPAGYTFVTADAGADDTKDSDVTGANGAGTTSTFTVAADVNNMTIDAGLRATTALNSIGDFVWYDLDKDGVQDAGETGVPGVTVTLYNATTGAVIKTTTTNTSGLYMFTDVPAGSYTIGFSNLPSGYTFSPADATGDAADSDPNPNTGLTATITVSGTGNIITTVDAGIISNPGGFNAKGSIGDFVWNDLNNNGIQDPGEPGIPGVTVTLYGPDGTTVIATTTTDALGNYQFSNLPAGTYIVGFSGFPSGYSLSTLPNAGTDDGKDSDADPVTGKTTPIILQPGQINTSIDAALRNPTVLARVGNYVWNDLDGNGFQGANEPGVPGVSVYLLNSSGAVIKNTVTDANGLYMFTDLAAGNYSIRFGNLPAGYVATIKDATPTNDALDSDADPTTLTTDPFALAAGAADMTRDFGIRSTTTATVGDFVFSDVNGNGQQDANEPGIPGVLVTLYNNSGVAVASTVTDANGKYLFVNVTPGTYTLGFSNLPVGSTFTIKDNGADATDSDVNPATGRTDPFTLTAGQANLTVDAGLVTRYAAVGNYVWQDVNSNGIQDAGEPGIAGVTVTLYNSANQPVASAVTDGNGYYFINNIPVPAGGANYTVAFTDIPTGYVFTTKNAAGSNADNDSNPNVTTGITDAFTLNPGTIRNDIDAGLIKLINLSGNVWHDVNGMNDNLVNNSGAAQTPPASAIPVGLRMYLVNASTGLIEKVTFVNSTTGTYSFSNINPNTVYRLYLSQAIYSVGTPETSINVSLPPGWQHTGQKNANPPNSPTGSDGINDGRVTVPAGSTDVINVNFGIRTSGGDVTIG